MKLLFVEDGSVDTNELDKLGINYIVFRQGSDAPRVVEVDDNRLRQQFIDEINAMSFEFSIYRRALQLACHYMEYEYPKKNDDIYYRKERELEMIFLDKAKEELEEQDVKNS